MAAAFIVIADTVKAGSGAGRSGQDEVSPRYCPRRPTHRAPCADCANIAGHKGTLLCPHSLCIGRVCVNRFETMPWYSQLILYCPVPCLSANTSQYLY